MDRLVHQGTSGGDVFVRRGRRSEVSPGIGVIEIEREPGTGV